MSILKNIHEREKKSLEKFFLRNARDLLQRRQKMQSSEKALLKDRRFRENLPTVKKKTRQNQKYL